MGAPPFGAVGNDFCYLWVTHPAPFCIRGEPANRIKFRIYQPLPRDFSVPAVAGAAEVAQEFIISAYLHHVCRDDQAARVTALAFAACGTAFQKMEPDRVRENPETATSACAESGLQC